MNKQFFSVFKNLIHLDFSLFKQRLLNRCIDLSIWVVITLIINGYVMQSFGVKQDYGVLLLCGIFASVGLFEGYSSVVTLVSDFESDQIINYHLTLPLPSSLIIAAKVTYFSISYFLLTLITFPLGKISLWHQLDLTTINYVQLILVFIVSNILYACLALLVASYVPTVAQLESVWMRFIFPLWFLGGFQFSWLALKQTVPLLAYINLLNPVTYVTEGIRAAIIGQNGYINFWMCILIITLASALSFCLALRKLQRRLDFV